MQRVPSFRVLILSFTTQRKGIPMKSVLLKRPARMLLTLFAGVFMSTAGMAHDNHGKPQFGGVVTEGGVFQLELVLRAKQVVLHISDHGKPVDVKGGTAKLTLLAGTNKSEVNLTASGTKFEANGDFPAGPGTKAVALVALPGKKAVTARFELK
jgi:hypothetical protein